MARIEGDLVIERSAGPVGSGSTFGVDLYWLPLGAGGRFVRLNGRMYEAAVAWRDKRPRRDLYHAALVVTAPEGEFVIEQAWPIPAGNAARRGVVAEGPVATRAARSLRFLRYEIRRWRDGVISDIDEAVDSPQRLTDHPVLTERLLELVPDVPTPVWGRDERKAGEMWNSNSLISWLIVRSGLDVRSVHPPAGGRAPGWDAGVVVAQREEAVAHARREPPVNASVATLDAGARARSMPERTARRREAAARARWPSLRAMASTSTGAFGRSRARAPLRPQGRLPTTWLSFCSFIMHKG